MKNKTTKPAVSEIYSKIQKFVGKRVRQTEDREELVQEIFLKLKKSLSQLKDEDRLLPWLYRVAHNQIVDHYRSRSTKAVAPKDYDQAGDERGAEAEVLVRQEVASWLEFFMKSLAPEDREILQLIEYEGKTQQEAALQLGLSLPAAKSRHQRAKQKLKSKLEACCDFYFDPRNRIIDYRQKKQAACCDAKGELGSRS
jgi:RNA polymerase sigma-70 factor (ECF subfamily)